jgi:Amidohydrolase family
MLQRERSTCRACVRRLSAICLVVFAPVVHSELAGSQDLRIENVTIVSPESTREIDGVTVTIHDGRIRSISSAVSAAAASGPSSAVQTLDGTNLYLIPGLIDSHVHLGGIPGMTDEQEKAHPDIAWAARNQFPRSYLYSGFTTVIDLISTPEGMARWKSHDPVPDTYFCGGAVLMDGYPSNYLPKESRYTAMPYWLVGARTPGSTLPPGVTAGEHTP